MFLRYLRFLSSPCAIHLCRVFVSFSSFHVPSMWLTLLSSAFMSYFVHLSVFSPIQFNAQLSFFPCPTFLLRGVLASDTRMNDRVFFFFFKACSIAQVAAE